MPDMLTGWQWPLAGLVILTAYFVRGLSGFGSGLIAIPLLALLLPLKLVVPLVVTLDYLGSASQGIHNRARIRWRDILPLLPFSLIGVILALYLFQRVDPLLLSRSLGVFIILFALYTLAALNPPRSQSVWWAVPAGTLGGLVGTLFGTGGPFYVIYLKLRDLDKTAFRATFATIFLLDGAARLTGYASGGFFDLDLLTLLALALPVMAVGLYLGGHVHGHPERPGLPARHQPAAHRQRHCPAVEVIRGQPPQSCCPDRMLKKAVSGIFQGADKGTCPGSATSNQSLS